MDDLKFNESHVEDYLYNNPEAIDLIDDNLQRQFRIDPYGIIDLLSYTHDEFSIIVEITEIKAEPLSVAHLSQLCRYMAGINHLFSQKFPEQRISVIGNLVTLPCRLSDENLFLFRHICDADSNICFFEYSVTLQNGISFRRQYHEWIRKGKFSRKIVKEMASAVKKRYTYIHELLYEFPDNFYQLLAQLNHRQRAKICIDITSQTKNEFPTDAIERYLVRGNPRIKKEPSTDNRF